MKYTFSKLVYWPTFLIAFAIFTFVPAQAENEPPVSMVLEAARHVAQLPVLEARVRQQVNMFDHDLNGHGTYQQARIDNRMRLRYELRLPVGERGTHVQQINDGDYVWLHQELLDGPQLSVIDLRRVRAAVVGRPDRAERLEVVGGLAQILYGLYDQFDFEAPRQGTLGKEPVWILDGHWRDTGAGQGGAPTSPQIPQFVKLVLSRDTLLPLFPFRIEYSRNEGGADGKTTRRVMMNIEFFEVRAGGSPDPRLFTFAAGDQAFHDATEEFVAAIK